MKTKTKLIATIIAMCLVVTLGVIGIFAVKTLNMTVGGNITFSADGLALEVSQGQFKTTENASYSNITTQNNKLQAFSIDTNTKQSSIQDKIDSWSGLELQLDSKGDAILHFGVTNKMTTPLYVYVTTNLGVNTNDNMDLIVSPNGTEIGAGATTNFTITFDIIDTNINAGLVGFNVAVNFAKENLIQTQNKIDPTTGVPTSDVDYYYVEMGIWGGKPVRWRYVADSSGERYDGTTSVTTLSGYYVLDSYIPTIYKSYLAKDKYDSTTHKHIGAGFVNINANDYGISDARAYLTNEGTGGFLKEIGISQDNLIYSLINGRTLTDLYKEIKRDGSTIDKTDSSYSLSFTGDSDISKQRDKFWLLSFSELTYLFPTIAERVWSDGYYYWLRSPGTSGAGYLFGVSPSGHTGDSDVFNPNCVRPAFKI